MAAFERYSDDSISETAQAYIKKHTWDFKKIAIEKMKQSGSFNVNITEELRKARADKEAVSDEDLDFALSEKSIECSEFKKAYALRKEKEQAEIVERESRVKAANAAQAKKDAEYKESRRLERLAWAQQHGSDRLRKGLEHGHACTKLYETEFGRHLIGDGGYVYDRDGRVETKDRSCPSIEALEEAEHIEKTKGLSVSIVWLPEGTWELHKDETCEPDAGCEAVRVDVRDTAGYWYKMF